jgi:DMSO/TMAO reductase YedYZ heme-binding membrane subunit
VIVVAAMSEHTWWWLSRATGLVAWVLSAAAIAFGLALSGRVVRRRRFPAWLLDMHRYLGTLTLAFVAMHMTALTLDTFAPFSASDLFVPMASAWRPSAVVWGIAAFYVLVVIQVTSWGMRWLPRSVWHAVHLTSFAVFACATVHAAQAGTDVSNRIVRTAALVGTVLVLVLLLVRVINGWRTGDDPSGARAAAAKARAAREKAASAAVVHASAAQEQWGHALVPDAGVDHLGHEHGVVAPADGVGDTALEPVGQVDEQGSAGLWAALEAEAVERVAIHGCRPEEGLPDVELVFSQHTDGEGAGALDEGMGVAVGLDADHHEGRLERGL